MHGSMFVSSTRVDAFAPTQATAGGFGASTESAVEPERGPASAGVEDTVTLSAAALERSERASASEEEHSSDEAASEASKTELSDEEHGEVDELEARDAEVRRHEMAHAAAGGQYAGSPNYEFETGPDGRRYAVGGHVNIDVGEVPGEPEKTIEKMRVVRAAALAPSEPSGQDRRVAAEASKKEAAARAELAEKDGSEDAMDGGADGVARDPTSASDGELAGRSHVSPRALLAERRVRRGYADASRVRAPTTNATQLA